MADLPRRIADFVEGLRRFLRPRPARPAAPRPTLLRLEPLPDRVLLSAGLTADPRALLYAAHADATPAVLASAPRDRYDAAFTAGADPMPSHADKTLDAIQEADARRYAEHEIPDAHDLAVADFFQALALFGDQHGGGRDGAARAPTQDQPAEAPAAATKALAPDGRSRADRAEPADRADGGADGSPAAEGATPTGGAAEIAAADDAAAAPALLATDWANPDLLEDLTPLQGAGLAFVPTYVLDGPAPPAAPPAHMESGADVALSGVVVSPDQAPTLRGPAAAPAGGEGAEPPVAHAPPLAPDGACMHRAADLRLIAAETGRLLTNLSRLLVEDRTAAAAVLAETLLVLGVWRATKPGRRT